MSPPVPLSDTPRVPHTGENIEIDEYGETVLLMQKAGADDFSTYHLDP